MSAFLCSDLHTHAIAIFWQGVTDEPASDTARTLRALNNYALLARYGQEPVQLGIQAVEAANQWIQDASEADVFSIVTCFRHQCAEGESDSLAGWSLMTEIYEASRAAAHGCTSDIWEI